VVRAANDLSEMILIMLMLVPAVVSGWPDRIRTGNTLECSTTLATATRLRTGRSSRTGLCRIDFPFVSPNRRNWLNDPDLLEARRILGLVIGD
jgi:hypothetical protein